MILLIGYHAQRLHSLEGFLHIDSRFLGSLVIERLLIHRQEKIFTHTREYGMIAVRFLQDPLYYRNQA